MEVSTQSHPATGRIIRLREVVTRIGLSRSTVYEKIASGEFPAPVALGGRRVGWKETEVDDWIESRPRVAMRRHGVSNGGEK